MKLEDVHPHIENRTWLLCGDHTVLFAARDDLLGAHMRTRVSCAYRRRRRRRHTHARARKHTNTCANAHARAYMHARYVRTRTHRGARTHAHVGSARVKSVSNRRAQQEACFLAFASKEVDVCECMCLCVFVRRRIFQPGTPISVRADPHTFVPTQTHKHPPPTHLHRPSDSSERVAT